MTRHFSFASLCMLAVALSHPASAQPDDFDTRPVLTPSPSSTSSLTLDAGQSRILRFPAITSAAVGNPAVADIAIVSKTEVLLNAKGPGQTLLYVQNARGSASITVNVGGTAMDMNSIGASASQALLGTGVAAQVAGDTLFLRGRVDTPADEQQAISIAKAFTPKVTSLITVGRTPSVVAGTIGDILKPMGVTARAAGDDTIVIEGSTSVDNAASLTKVISQIAANYPGYQIVNMSSGDAPTRKVIIHVRVIDVDQLALRNLGVDWGAVTADANGAASNVAQPFIIGANSGGFGRLNKLGAALQALEEGNRAKTLSAPDLVTQDNHKADMLVGGQIPVPVPQVGGGSNVIVIDYKDYGVKMSVTPHVVDDGTVTLDLAPEVSTLDYSNAINLNGYRIPAFSVRRASTEVTMNTGQTLVFAGLLQDQDADNMRKIPLLGDLPFFGELFKFRSTSRTKTQLVIMVTPEILQPGQTPPVPNLGILQPDSIKLKPVGTNANPNDPPTMKDAVPSGATPIPMSH